MRHIFLHTLSVLEEAGGGGDNVRDDRWRRWLPVAPVPSPGPFATTLVAVGVGGGDAGGENRDRREWGDGEVLSRLFARHVPQSQPQVTVL